MSFSVDLWNSYDFVENNLMLHYRGLKDFIYLLTEKYKYEKTLSEGLKKFTQQISLLQHSHHY